MPARRSPAPDGVLSDAKPPPRRPRGSPVFTGQGTLVSITLMRHKCRAMGQPAATPHLLAAVAASYVAGEQRVNRLADVTDETSRLTRHSVAKGS